MDSRAVNLPSAITIGRIAAAPILVVLALSDAWPLRALAFVVFVCAAVTDYWDGKLARSRNLVTNLGRLLDPLADKLLLVAALIPMLVHFPSLPFVTPVGAVGLPAWVFIVVVGREAIMTAFRQAAARRGVVIAAIAAAKWKTGVQWVWVGAAFFWFAAAAAAAQLGWGATPLWHAAAEFIGTVGLLTMTGAVALTLYSLGLYLRRYGGVLAHRADHHRG
jgi:CDP-diacylglycerol--glycerol-3-phosphate 3-phosphatidyltransferase